MEFFFKVITTEPVIVQIRFSGYFLDFFQPGIFFQGTIFPIGHKIFYNSVLRTRKILLHKNVKKTVHATGYSRSKI